MTRSSSKSTRGSWTSGGSWSAKWVTRSSASQALTSWSVEDGLPGRLVADIVAELEALRHELLGLARALFRGQDEPCRDNRKAGRSSENQTPAGIDDQNTEAEADPEQPFARFCASDIPISSVKGTQGRETTSARGDESGCRLGGPDVETWSSRTFKLYDLSQTRSTRAFQVDHGRSACLMAARRSSLANAGVRPLYEAARVAHSIAVERIRAQRESGAMPSRFVSLAILIYWSIAAFCLLTWDVIPELTLGISAGPAGHRLRR